MKTVAQASNESLARRSWVVALVFAGLLWTLRGLFLLRGHALMRGAGDTALGLLLGAAADLGFAFALSALLGSIRRRSPALSTLLGLAAIVLLTATAAIETEYFAWGRNRFDALFLSYAAEWRALGGSVSGEASPLFLALHLVVAAVAASALVGTRRAPPTSPPLLAAMAIVGVGLIAFTFAAPHRGHTWFGSMVARTSVVELARAVTVSRPTPPADASTEAAIAELQRFTNPFDSKTFHDPAAPLAHLAERAPDGVFARTTKPLNVLYVLLEGMEAAPLAHAGGSGALTPELDRLADRGLYLRHFFANGAHTPRAMDAALCGLYPRLAGAPLSRAQPRMPVACLSAVLRDRGYRTAFIHGGHEAFENRFEFLGHIGFHETRFFEQFGAKAPPWNGNWGTTDAETYSQSLDWLDARDQNRPFFLTVLSISNHHPFRVPDPALETEHDEALRPNDTIRYADREVGRFVAALEQRGLLENTVIFILGDHGLTRSNANAAGAGALPELMLARANVPLIVLTPPGTIAPKVVERLASQVDLMPTALDLLGVDSPTHAVGHSLARALADDRDLPVFIHDLYSGLVASISRETMTVVEVEPGTAPFANGTSRWHREGGHLRAEPIAPDLAEQVKLRSLVTAIDALYSGERWWSPRLRLAATKP